MGVENKQRTEAKMNPEAVKKAKIFTGKVNYHNGREMIQIENGCFVEVGKITAVGSESKPEDYLDTYHAAKLLGLAQEKKRGVEGPYISWLPAGDDDTGDRKFLIYKDIDPDGKIISLDKEEAKIIATQINYVLHFAKIAKSDPKSLQKNFWTILSRLNFERLHKERLKKYSF